MTDVTVSGLRVDLIAGCAAAAGAAATLGRLERVKRMRDHCRMPSLLSTREIRRPVRAYLDSVGDIFTVFGPQTQDSGNLSFGVRTPDGRFFAKTTDPEASVHLGLEDRIGLLRNAVTLADRCPHPTMPALLNVIETPAGPMLVYEWVEGDLLRRESDDPASAHQRFRALPVGEIVSALDELFELHASLAVFGYVAADFYDGCLIYDFAARRLRVIDLDHYHPGPFVNAMGRLFGSSRFMAPEEFMLGATIDERTTVFNLGRAATIFLDGGAPKGRGFRGGERRHGVVAKACAANPSERFETVADFLEAWRASA